MSIDRIRDQFNQYRDLLPPRLDGRLYFDFMTTPLGDATPHVEVDEKMHFVISERGVEHERRTTDSEDDILYWLISNLAHEYAFVWEAYHRLPFIDSRRRAFRKHRSILRAIDSSWAKRAKLQHDWLLHPMKRNGLPMPL